MRQADVIEAIKDIILEASVDASPENYDICHRFVTRSDPAVYASFDQAREGDKPIDAATFQGIRETAGPPRGQIDITRHMANLDGQLAAILGAARGTIGDAATYTSSLAEGASLLSRLDIGPDATVIISDLIAHTHAMSERTALLESNLATASSELATLRGDLERAKLESGSDALTSLPNRRAFDARLVEAISAASATHEPLSIAFCDVDHFKQFNDTWGHKLGDEVLRYVASVMNKHFSEIGVPARFGGEEFVVLLPGRSEHDAFDLVQSFCSSVAERMLKVRADGRTIGKITLSAGVATLRDRETPEAFIERADQAMYAAKAAGRNQVLQAA
jgi:diguanylate cyclase